MAQTRRRHCHSLLVLLQLLLTIVPPTHGNEMSSVDITALSDIKKSLRDIPAGGTNFFSTWDFTSPDPCSTFTGVTCSLDRVTALTLGTGLSDSAGLAGWLPPSISNLTELTQLILFPGLVTGPIPPQLGQLSNLRVLSLTGNRLSGPIPTSLSWLRWLHTLDLSHNQLSGSIPQGLSGLTQLKVMIMASNRLSGELTGVGGSQQLLHLDVKSNRLRGGLPEWLPSTLRYLSVSDNSMGGPLEGGVLESLKELVYLDLSMNGFSGSVPPSLFRRPTLSSMLLQRNNLSGGLADPTSTSTSTSAQHASQSIVDLSHNYISGELPLILAGVETLFLNNNRLVGRVPKEYVESVCLGRTKTLYLQHNYITGFPLDPSSSSLPHSVSLCLSYNCMIPPVGLSACPLTAARHLSRPISQCPLFNTTTTTTNFMH